MNDVIKIENATFLESDLRYYAPGLVLGWFAIALDGRRRKRVYLGMYHTDPETGQTVRTRSYSEDAKIIEKLKPGDPLSLFVHAWDWTTRDSRCNTFSLA